MRWPERPQFVRPIFMLCGAARGMMAERKINRN
jgi:hypothetical protein